MHKHIHIILAGMALMVSGCQMHHRLFSRKESDRYTMKALERKFGELEACDNNHSCTNGSLGFRTLHAFGIWESAYIQVTPLDSAYRLDFVNLHHYDGTTFEDWLAAVQRHFHTDLEATDIQFHGGVYDGWRVGCKSSSPLIHSAFCWVEPDGKQGDMINPKAKLRWEWGRVLYAPYYAAKQSSEKAARAACGMPKAVFINEYYARENITNDIIESRNLTPEEGRQRLSSFGSIGIAINTNDAGCVVKAVLENTPALAAGILSGDIILSVDGTDLGGLSLQEVVKALHGPPGATANLTILRAGLPSLIMKSVVREIVYVPKKMAQAKTVSDMEALGQSAAEGSHAAVDQIEMAARHLYENINYSAEQERVRSNLVLMTSAFIPLAEAAGKGSSAAMEALKYANGKNQLRPFTPQAFGIAAGMGNQEALTILLNYKENGLLLPSAVFALKSAAENNIPEAVDLLLEVMSNPAEKALWHGASLGLTGAAALGNEKAQKALIEYNNLND